MIPKPDMVGIINTNKVAIISKPHGYLLPYKTIAQFLKDQNKISRGVALTDYTLIVYKMSKMT